DLQVGAAGQQAVHAGVGFARGVVAQADGGDDGDGEDDAGHGQQRPAGPPAAVAEDVAPQGRIVPVAHRPFSPWPSYPGRAPPAIKRAFEEFCHREAGWLDEYSLFMALKDHHQGVSWHEWSDDLIRRKPAVLERMRRTLAPSIDRHKLGQFLFDRQWSAVKAHAAEKGIKLIGDI